nr:MAG TPA: hypothetical protein [Caudoviricetes sp.]
MGYIGGKFSYDQVIIFKTSSKFHNCCKRSVRLSSSVFIPNGESLLLPIIEKIVLQNSNV